MILNPNNKNEEQSRTLCMLFRVVLFVHRYNYSCACDAMISSSKTAFSKKPVRVHVTGYRGIKCSNGDILNAVCVASAIRTKNTGNLRSKSQSLFEFITVDSRPQFERSDLSKRTDKPSLVLYCLINLFFAN